MATSKSVPFNIIKFKGDANTVTLYDGTKIQRNKDEFIFVPEFGGFVRKAEYGNHFIFEVPRRMKGTSYMCSCGSPSVAVGTKAYSHLGSPSGMMFVCWHHTTFNKHADGSS